MKLWPAWQTIVSQEHANEQKTRPGLTLKQFLAERMPGSAALLLSLAQELRRRLLESMDVQHCTAVFKLHVPHNEIIAVLDPKPELIRVERADPNAEAPEALYHWMLKGETEELSKTTTRISAQPPRVCRRCESGELIYLQGKVVLQTPSLEKYRLARRVLEACLGTKIELENESMVISRSAPPR